jgi:hypothetical protein
VKHPFFYYICIMNVDVQIYLNNLKQFFENNPNDLMTLIGDKNKDVFYNLVEKQVIENFEKGDDLELTKKQIIDIMLILTKENDKEKIEKWVLKGKFTNVILN